MRNRFALFFLTLTLAGCATQKIRQGGIPDAIHSAGNVYVAPFYNTTANPSASRTLTELTTTTLAAYGLPVIQSEQALLQGYAMLESGKAVDFLQLARSVGASHAIIGTVHEYRFKSDLDGAPTVGLTMRLVDTMTGETLWQGTSARSSGYYGSLTSTAQGAIDHLVKAMGGKGGRSVVRTAKTTEKKWSGNSSKSTTSGSVKTVKPAPEFEQIRRQGDSLTTTTVETTSYENYTVPSPVSYPPGGYVPPPAPGTYPPPTPAPALPAPPPPNTDSAWIPVR
jgi:hypothetical protein